MNYCEFNFYFIFYEKMKKKKYCIIIPLVCLKKSEGGKIERERVSCRPGLSVFQLDVDSAWPVPFYPHELAPNRLGAPVSIYDGKIQLTEFHVRIWRRESRRAEAQPQPHTHTQGEEAINTRRRLAGGTQSDGGGGRFLAEERKKERKKRARKGKRRERERRQNERWMVDGIEKTGRA